MKHYNVEGDEVNFTVSDPYQASVIWDCTGYGSTQRLTRWYVNLLTNEFTGGSGVKDPRLSKLVPAMMTNVKLNADGKITANEWIRDAGVDVIHSTTRAEGGPVAALFVTGGETGYNKEKGGFMITYDLFHLFCNFFCKVFFFFLNAFAQLITGETANRNILTDFSN